MWSVVEAQAPPQPQLLPSPPPPPGPPTVPLTTSVRVSKALTSWEGSDSAVKFTRLVNSPGRGGARFGKGWGV
jgi:hypothetical protein